MLSTIGLNFCITTVALFLFPQFSSFITLAFSHDSPVPCNQPERDRDQKLSPETLLSRCWDELRLSVDRLLPERTLRDNGQFPPLPAAAYLYSSTGLQALL